VIAHLDGENSAVGFRRELDRSGAVLLCVIEEVVDDPPDEDGIDLEIGQLSALRSTAFDETDTMPATVPSPSEVAGVHERQQVLRDLLAELPDEQSETLLLRTGLGWTLDEIARKTRIPVNTVRSRLRLAKMRLRSRIESNPELCELLDRDRDGDQE
jgi:RNA polymerase sigma factor (sigma-70 family)